MEIKEFIQNFANQFDDTEVSEFAADTNFRDLEEWSSMIGLSLLNMSEKSYGVQLTFDELRSANTVQDLFDIISKKQG